MPYIIALFVIFIIVVISNIKVVPQAFAYVIERFGGYHTTWGVGIHVKVPFIDRISKKVNLKEQVVDFPPQPVITKDNVSMQIDTVIYFQITDPKLYTYGVERPMMAIENLTATTLRNIIGDLDLDGTLTSRDTVNTKMRAILDEATDPWGIKINRVELKNIIPPREIQNAMEKQMKAVRQFCVPRVKSGHQSLWLRVKKNLQFSVLRLKSRLQYAKLKVKLKQLLPCRQLSQRVSKKSTKQRLHSHTSQSNHLKQWKRLQMVRQLSLSFLPTYNPLLDWLPRVRKL